MGNLDQPFVGHEQLFARHEQLTSAVDDAFGEQVAYGTVSLAHRGVLLMTSLADVG